MRKRKLLILPLFFVVAILFSAIYVTAHSGKTDSSGGHHNSATGEYHYHHGYPAHSHKDMDGDGEPDCPYDFDDQTNHAAASSSTSNRSSDRAENIATTEESGDISFGVLLPFIVVFGYLLWKMICVIVVLSKKRKTKK